MKEHIVSLSGGKDSSVMLLEMFHRDYQIDKIVYAHVGEKLEFPEMKDWIKYLEKYVGIKIDILEPRYDFEDWFYGIPKRGERKTIRGYPLSFYGCYIRRDMKVVPLNKYCGYNYRYIGFCVEELKRSTAKTYNDNYRFPLIEWGMSEEDCRNYLKENNHPFPFFEYKRTGCMMCPKQPKESLRLIYQNYPDYWQWMKELEKVSVFNPKYKLEEIEGDVQ